MAWHARLSASGSAIWMNCAGSVNEIARLPAYGRSGSSVYAAEGTAAHHVGGHCLTHGMESAYELVGRQVHVAGDGDDAYWPEDVPAGMRVNHVFDVDGEMAEAVDVYLRACHEVRDRYPAGEELVETTMDMSWLDERFGGTADFMFAEPFGLLDVIDLKYGKGVIVEVVGNTQLKKYGVGALHYHPDCDRVRVTIVQPRAWHPDGPVRSVTYERWELDEFADEMKAAAVATEDPDAPLSAGHWCETHFCPAMATCPAARAHVISIAQQDFADDPDEIPVIAVNLPYTLPWIPYVERWCSESVAMAQRALESGLEVPGYKLVRGTKTKRKWVEQDVRKLVTSIQRVAKKVGIKLSRLQILAEPKPLSPSKIEKMGKGLKAALEAEGLWEKPEGALSMAPDDDPRDAERPSIVTDFEEEPDA